MNNIYQKLALFSTGAALSLVSLGVNPAQAKVERLEKDSYLLANPATSVFLDDSFNYERGNLPLAQENPENIMIAQAQPWASRTYFLTTRTNNQGFFRVPHGLDQTLSRDGYTIYGIVVSIQHVNGNWHTLEFSHEVDNRFWWNNTNVEGIIRSPNFYNRPVRIVIFAVVRVA